MENLPEPHQDPIRPPRIQYAESPRLLKIRYMSRLLDQSIVLPGGFKIGLDPLIGLIPGLGDIVATGLSFYIVYQAARMGIPKRILARMCGNIIIEGLVGEIPLIGDIFDAVYKANYRNAQLVELHHAPAHEERSVMRVLAWVVMWYLCVMLITLTMAILVLAALIAAYKKYRYG